MEEGNRTPDPWIHNPVLEIANDIIGKELTSQEQTDLSTGLAILLQKHPKLKQIIKVWPQLPEHIKEAINALIQTHNKQ